MLTTLWRKCFGTSLKRKPYRRHPQQLSIEILEDRCLLAAYLWTGLNAAVNLNWNNPLNWAGGPANTWPGKNGAINDVVTFNGTSTRNCTLPLGNSITIAQLTVAAASAASKYFHSSPP